MNCLCYRDDAGWRSKKRVRNRAMKKGKYCQDHEVSLDCVESTGRNEA